MTIEMINGSKVDSTSGLIYREPTWTLRITIFLLYYAIFMNMAAAGVFFYAGIFVYGRIDLLIISIVPIFLQLWIARGLSNYNQRSRITFIIFTVIVLLLSILVRILATKGPSLAAITIFLIAGYCFYAMVFHRDTVELFSGKYRREPDLS